MSAKFRWQRVVFADDCEECSCCGEPWCATCGAHYADCQCPGPTQEDAYEYRVDRHGVVSARKRDA